MECAQLAANFARIMRHLGNRRARLGSERWALVQISRRNGDRLGRATGGAASFGRADEAARLDMRPPAIVFRRSRAGWGPVCETPERISVYRAALEALAPLRWVEPESGIPIRIERPPLCGKPARDASPAKYGRARSHGAGPRHMGDVAPCAARASRTSGRHGSKWRRGRSAGRPLPIHRAKVYP